MMFKSYTTVLGGGECGKSYFTKKNVLKHKGGALYINFIGERKDWKGFIEVDENISPSRLKSLLANNYKVVYHCSLKSKIREKEIIALWSLVKVLAKQNLLVVFDEVHLYNTKELKEIVNESATVGRHYTGAIVWISQRMAYIPKILVTQSNKIVFFKQNMEGSYYKQHGIDSNKIERLINGRPYYYCIYENTEITGSFKE